MTDDLSDPGAPVLMFVLFLLIGALIFGDLVIDYRKGVGLSHVLVEGSALLLAVAGVAVALLRMNRARRSVAALRRDLDQVRSQAAHWQQENEKQVQGIARAINAQFKAWEYTEAESDVALLLIKGLSHREIAGLRETSERTVRHQAQSAYRKAALSGRTALSAFFLEDMLPGR